MKKRIEIEVIEVNVFAIRKILIVSLKFPFGFIPFTGMILLSEGVQYKIQGIVFNNLNNQNIWDCAIEYSDIMPLPMVGTIMVTEVVV